LEASERRQRELLLRQQELLEREHAARERAEALAREADKANRLKDDFLANLSHELRTPLNAILGWSQLISGGQIPADEVTQGIQAIARNARAQAQLVDDLLDMSRLLAGQLRLDVRRTELAPLVEAALQVVAPAAEAKNLRLQRELDPAVGAVLGDPARLQQVAWNLLQNAVKFTEAGGAVRVAARRVKGNVELTVSDTGIGIRPEFLPHVFDRFRQYDGSITRAYGGLGLGLSIVRHLSELHGGTVRAMSEGEGRGATFTLTLPVAPAADGPQPEPGQAVAKRE
jgi:signal transduction histidine kinase